MVRKPAANVEAMTPVRIQRKRVQVAPLLDVTT